MQQLLHKNALSNNKSSKCIRIICALDFCLEILAHKHTYTYMYVYACMYVFRFVGAVSFERATWRMSDI